MKHVCMDCPVSLSFLSTISLSCICTTDILSHSLQPNSRGEFREIALCIFLMVVIVEQSNKKHCIVAFKQMRTTVDVLTSFSYLTKLIDD